MVKLAWVAPPGATRAGLPYDELLAVSLLASWVGLGRRITDAELPLAELHFRHPAPKDALPFTGVFGFPMHFAAGENALLFTSELLTQPQLQADAGLNLALRDKARNAINRPRGRRAIAAQVRQLLTPRLSRCKTTLKHVAAGLGITPPT